MQFSESKGCVFWGSMWILYGVPLQNKLFCKCQSLTWWDQPLSTCLNPRSWIPRVSKIDTEWMSSSSDRGPAKLGTSSTSTWTSSYHRWCDGKVDECRNMMKLWFPYDFDGNPQLKEIWPQSSFAISRSAMVALHHVRIILLSHAWPQKFRRKRLQKRSWSWTKDGGSNPGVSSKASCVSRQPRSFALAGPTESGLVGNLLPMSSNASYAQFLGQRNIIKNNTRWSNKEHETSWLLK